MYFSSSKKSTHLSFGPSSNSWRVECWSFAPIIPTGRGPMREFLPRLSAMSCIVHLLKYSKQSMYGNNASVVFFFCVYI